MLCFCKILELSVEVTSLRTELGSVGTDMKGMTDTISELTRKTPFCAALGMMNKNALFLHSMEQDTITVVTNRKLLFLL
jgi:hypothetical protein